MSNRAIPDQLMSIRQKIAALEAEAKALREMLRTDPSTRIGDEYVATPRSFVSYRVKGTDLEKANPELYAQLAVEVVVEQVMLTRRVQT